MFNNRNRNKTLRASRHIKLLKEKNKQETIRQLRRNRKHSKVVIYKRHHLIYGIISVLAITICYHYVDRNASTFFSHIRRTDFYNVLFWMQYLSNLLEYLIPFVYLYLILMLLSKRFYYFEEFLFASANSLLISVSLKDFFKNIFGRYWTETFTNNNPSLIQNNAYGFNFFHYGRAYDSFPSGHSAVVFAVMTVLWVMYPRLRWLSALCCIMVVVGLLGCNFHFPSDIIAGAFIGVIVAYFVLHASQVFARNIREHKDQIYKK
jgi:membrane-associated phospholipid phosphatase